MELSSKLKAMKFMKRKDEAEERKQAEMNQQKSVDRTHWTLEDKSMNEDSGRPKIIIEYDYSGGFDSGAVGRVSYSKAVPKTSSKEQNSALSGPQAKIPKLEDDKKKNSNK